jgi:hypothetical protein
MWEWLQKAGKRLSVYAQDRSFILSLFNMLPQQAHLALRERVGQMDDTAAQSFASTLAGMIGEAQAPTYNYGGGQGSSWGVSTEDRIAQGLAELQTGYAGEGNQANAYLQGLNMIAFYANQFWQEKKLSDAQSAQAVSAAFAPAPSAPQPGPQTLAESERLLEEFMKTGKLDPALLSRLQSLNDEDAIDRITTRLKQLGADEGASPPLVIEDYYKVSTAKFKLEWPLSPTLSLPVPFDQLDRKTQFYVLFNEWTRREMEGMQALTSGDLAGAEAIFRESIGRAEHLEVAELKARSYEGLMRVAQRRNDRAAERKWLDAAMRTREDA